jgi:hypothetical protein
VLGGREALELARDVDELYVAKGKRVMYVDLRQHRPAAAELEALLLGPTGKLRAPTLRIGRRLVVGYNEATYRSLLLGRNR